MSGVRGGATYSPGPALQDMSVIADGGGHSWALHVAAYPGTSQDTATPMRAAINVIDTAQEDGDSVALPPAFGGQLCYVENRTTYAISVWTAAGTTDTIYAGTATGNMAPLLAGSMVMLVSTPGQWALASAPPSAPVTGPPGPQGPPGQPGAPGAPGPTSVSADAGNQARLGSDTLLFVPAPSIPTASTMLPVMDGTPTVGASIAWSPGDHAHPTDTTRAPVHGVTDGSNAAAGNVGEFLSVQCLSTAAVSAATGVDATVTSLSLSPGDWNVWGSAGFTMSNCTGITLRAWLNAGGSNAPPIDQLGGNAASSPSNNTPQMIMPITPMRIATASPVTVTLGVTPSYGGPSPVCSAWGKILARRQR